MDMKWVESETSDEAYIYQVIKWDMLKKSINALVGKVNATNIKNIILELFSENLIRGRGLFIAACIRAQTASPGLTDVFAALVAVVNAKIPEAGDFLLRMLIMQVQYEYMSCDNKHRLLSDVKFIAHLVNQRVFHELIAFETLTMLLENSTNDGVEVAVEFVTECGSILQELSPESLNGIFERFHGILHKGEIDKRVQLLVEGLIALKKAEFQSHPAIRPELNLVSLEDQVTHKACFSDKMNIDPVFVFKLDPNYLENEKRYEDLKKSVLGDESPWRKSTQNQDKS